MAQVDFYNMLSGLGDTIAKQRTEANRKQALAGAVGPDGTVDFQKAILGFSQIGDMESAARVAAMADRVEQRKFQQSQATQAQSNADRSFSASQSNAARSHALQERQLNEGKLPAGFERNPGGGLRPLPGGPADPAYKRTVTDRQNAPPGYKWADPSNPEMGLTAIPGGPGERVPAEVAARLGLAKSFLGQLYDYTDETGTKQTGLRDRIAKGEMTGLIDGVQGAAGIGEPGSIARKISSGAEALLRNLTGAGMNIDEAKKYVARYEPQWNDSAKTLLDKVDQLARELRSVNDVVSQGRGGSVLDRPSATKPPPAAVEPFADRFNAARRGNTTGPTGPSRELPPGVGTTISYKDYFRNN